MKTKICTKCKIKKTLGEFSPHKLGKYGKQSVCKDCHRIICRNWHRDNKEKSFARHAKWKKENPEKFRKSVIGSNWKRLGIDCDDKLYNDLFSKQNGCCAICGTHQSKLRRALDVDHNHVTGKTRGLLCGKCNLGGGNYCMDTKGTELLLKAVKYIKIYK